MTKRSGRWAIYGSRVVRNVDGHVVVTGKVRRTAYHAAYLLAHAGQVLRRERETVPVAFASYPQNAARDLVAYLDALKETPP